MGSGSALNERRTSSSLLLDVTVTLQHATLRKLIKAAQDAAWTLTGRLQAHACVHMWLRSWTSPSPCSMHTAGSLKRDCPVCFLLCEVGCRCARASSQTTHAGLASAQPFHPWSVCCTKLGGAGPRCMPCARRRPAESPQGDKASSAPVVPMAAFHHGNQQHLVMHQAFHSSLCGLLQAAFLLGAPLAACRLPASTASSRLRWPTTRQPSTSCLTRTHSRQSWPSTMASSAMPPSSST